MTDDEARAAGRFFAERFGLSRERDHQAALDRTRAEVSALVQEFVDSAGGPAGLRLQLAEGILRRMADTPGLTMKRARMWLEPYRTPR